MNYSQLCSINLNGRAMANQQTIKKTFPVIGMSCAVCAGTVESTVKKQAGVVDASVNFASALLSVEFNPRQIQASVLKKSVQEAGYDLIINESTNQQELLEDIQAQKLKSLRTNTFLAIVLSIPVVVYGMFLIDKPYANIMMWALSTLVVLWFGRRFFVNAWKQAVHGKANMDTLVALSTGIAYLFSVFNVLYPSFWHSRGLYPHVYFEAAAVVISFLLLGKLLEEKAKSNTSSAINKLLRLQPKTVTIIDSTGEERDISLEDVRVGDLVLVRPGDKVAVDGIVSQGSSYVDESLLSGEPVPILKQEKDRVYAGTINQKGSFRYTATKVGRDTLLAHIIRSVQEAQGSKPPVQKLVDKIAGVFVPVVICIAILSFVLWLLIGGKDQFFHGLLAAITVLVIACPCALGLATPTAIMVGIGKAAESGILVKDAQSLERAKQINAIILDKTGTITEGKPQVVDVCWTQEEEYMKQILLSIEKHSEHPLAEAVVEYLSSFSPLPIDSFESITGQGVKAIIDGVQYFVGNKSFVQHQGVALNKQQIQKAKQWQEQANTVIFFANEKEYLALIALADTIKVNSKEAIAHLQSMDVEVYMLTGDNQHTASAIAQQVGIRYFQAEMLPQDKADFIKHLQEQGKIVGMVGDGINDSTALAQADVGIAMGQGSDITIDAASMTIITSDLQKVVHAIRVSKKTVQTIRQNLFWAFIYNVIGIPLAAGVLYPINGFLLNPMIAGAAMALSSVSVVTNSLLLKWKA